MCYVFDEHLLREKIQGIVLVLFLFIVISYIRVFPVCFLFTEKHLYKAIIFIKLFFV